MFLLVKYFFSILADYFIENFHKLLNFHITFLFHWTNTLYYMHYETMTNAYT